MPRANTRGRKKAAAKKAPVKVPPKPVSTDEAMAVLAEEARSRAEAVAGKIDALLRASNCRISAWSHTDGNGTRTGWEVQAGTAPE